MSKKLAVVLFVMSALGVAWAAADKSVEKVGSAFATHFDKGIYIGPANPNPTNDTLNKVYAIRTCNPTINIPSAAAATTVVATGTCANLSVGDVIVGVAPAADDAAFDEGVVWGFAESANTVKLVYHADATGGDPASMVYYITFIERS